MSQRELADAVGISAGSVHYVLSALVAAGLIKCGNFRSAEDKRRYAYILTPYGIAQCASMTRQFLAKKIEEFEALRAEIDLLREELGEKCDAGDAVPDLGEVAHLAARSVSLKDSGSAGKA